MSRIFRHLILLLVFTGAMAGFYYWFTYQPPPKPPKLPVTIEPSGGEYFSKRVEITVPQLRQNDPQWGKEPLARGAGGDTLGSAGCAVTSTAMILCSYGIKTDPSKLNKFLVAHGGFTEQGWLMWEKAVELAPTKLKFVYEGDPTYKDIDRNLKNGNPVIVRIRYESGMTHFLVVCGKEGHDYLVRDPGGGASKGVYPLKEIGSKIEALRYYEKL